MKQQAVDRRLKMVKLIYLVSGVLYFLLGIGFNVALYAQERVPTEISTHPILPVPTGSSDRVVEAYYNYLDLRFLRSLQETYFTNPILISWIYGILALFLILFYLLVFIWYWRRSSLDLYPVEIYNGYISERATPVDPFVYAVAATIVGYAVYYIAVNFHFGQMY